MEGKGGGVGLGLLILGFFMLLLRFLGLNLSALGDHVLLQL